MTTALVVFLLQCIGVNLVVLAVVIVGIGASAPRWSRRWLTRDAGLLRLLPGETPELYRRLPVRHWAKRLPELGATFGGASKRALPGQSTQAVADYLVEVRRAEWVHWASFLALLPMLAYNPWYLWLGFALVTTCINAPFLLILRGNRARLSALRERA